MTNVLPNIDDNFELGLMIAQRVWVACYDSESDVKALAERYTCVLIDKIKAGQVSSIGRAADL